MILFCLCRTLKAFTNEIRHSDRIKLPNGIVVVPMKGFDFIDVGSMQFRPYYVTFIASTSQ